MRTLKRERKTQFTIARVNGPRFASSRSVVARRPHAVVGPRADAARGQRMHQAQPAPQLERIATEYLFAATRFDNKGIRLTNEHRLYRWARKELGEA
jgi:hypothetical protein